MTGQKAYDEITEKKMFNRDMPLYMYSQQSISSHFIQFKSTRVTAIPVKMAPLVRMMLMTSPNTNVSAKIGSLEQTVKVMFHLNLKVVDSFIL